FIGLAGECLEAFTFARTRRALGTLAELFPQRCWVLRDGREVRTYTTDLQAGDRVVVKPGGRIPVDGVVVDGRSAVDASALTGESLPLDKGPGDSVLAGSIVQAGALTIEAKKVAKQTIAGQVIELTAAALKDKAPVQRRAHQGRRGPRTPRRRHRLRVRQDRHAHRREARTRRGDRLRRRSPERGVTGRGVGGARQRASGGAADPPGSGRPRPHLP